MRETNWAVTSTTCSNSDWLFAPNVVIGQEKGCAIVRAALSFYMVVIPRRRDYVEGVSSAIPR
jgi:hypothetical protein